MDQWVREQYKSKGGFGMKTLETRRSATVINRKEQRNTLLRKFRNIPETMSPLMSPMVPRVREEKKTPSKNLTVDAKSRRLNMLKKWKEERERKKIEAKKNAKPVFKVFHVEHSENLDNIYNNIKGKTINLKGNVAKSSSGENLTSKTATVALGTLNKSPNLPKENVITNKSGFDTKRSNFGLSGKRKISKKETRGNGVEEKTSKTSNRLVTGQNKSENILAVSKPVRSTRLNLKANPENMHKSSNEKNSNSSISKKLQKSKSPKKNMKSIHNIDNNDQQISIRRSQRKNKDYTDQDEPKIKFESNRLNDKENLLELNKDSSLVEKNNHKAPNRSRRKESTRIDEEEKGTLSPSKFSRDKSVSQKSLDINKKSSSSGFCSIESNIEDNFFATPKKKSSENEICYVSPFVTLSRGKAAARKEFEQRKSLNGSIFNTSMSATDPRSPKAAAAYFTRMLNNEINRIQDMCKIWQSYKDEEDISEDACGLIDMTIGQSNLLISKKFNQFRGLIEKCRTNDELDMKIQCEDLHGFWDMIYKQVTDLDRRFENLEDMKKNNWLEKAPKVKTPKKVNKEKKKGRSKSTKASSGLKETILAARKYRLKQIQSEGDLEILIVGKSRTPRRASRNIKEGGTPGKGILKSTNVKSEKKKSVAFHNLMENLGDNKENSSRISKGTPIPSRRSERLSLNRSKLVFDE